MALDPALLALLACPVDKGPLVHVEAECILYNPRQRRCYEIRDDIPVMLPEESTVLDDAEHARLTELIEREGLRPTFEP
jgi:uncharacterized protein